MVRRRSRKQTSPLSWKGEIGVGSSQDGKIGAAFRPPDKKYAAAVTRRGELALVASGEISDTKTIVGLLWADKLRRGDWS